MKILELQKTISKLLDSILEVYDTTLDTIDLDEVIDTITKQVDRLSIIMFRADEHVIGFIRHGALFLTLPPDMVKGSKGEVESFIGTIIRATAWGYSSALRVKELPMIATHTVQYEQGKSPALFTALNRDASPTEQAHHGLLLLIVVSHVVWLIKQSSESMVLTLGSLHAFLDVQDKLNLKPT